MLNKFNRTRKVSQPINKSITLPRHSTNLVNHQIEKKSLLKRFNDLPINRKQFIALIICELVPILGIGIVGTIIITSGLRTQLLEQAKSELAVTDSNYNIKLNQMGLGFRGQSDNPVIIGAAITHNFGQSLNKNLQSEVKKILQNETKARKIEYATLVGKDLKIVVNANKDREGETFNPNNLVSQAIKSSQQIKASAIISWSELLKESPTLPQDFNNQDALIRYTVTPVKDPQTRLVVGALVSGDIVNNKYSIVKETLAAIGGGYSGIYLHKPTGEFALATALDKGKSQNFNNAKSNLELPTTEGNSLLQAAAKAKQGQIVTGRMTVGNQTYTMAAMAIPNKIIQQGDESQPVFSEESVAILVRGTPETALNNLIIKSLWLELFIVAVALGLIGIWATILRRGIIQPVENLQQAAQKFAVGDRTSRASIFSADEIGQLAVNFNQMADNITAQANHQENEAKLARQLNVITASIRETLNIENILKTAVSSTKEGLNVDRVICYRFDESQGKIISEAVNYQYPVTLGKSLIDSYLKDEYDEEYQQQSVKVLEDIDTKHLPQEYLEQLKAFDVKAYLLAPIVLNKKLHGVIMAHQCSSQRQWQDTEINLFKQIAIQVGFALEQAELVQQIEKGRENAETVSFDERQQKETLQMQLIELLEDVEGAASGDLTVRADVSEGEIGTVADFFNSIIESLREIVTKVKASVIQVNAAIGSNSSVVHQLAQESLTQATDINLTLSAVDKMTHETQFLANNAQQAALVANTARNTATKSGKAMDLTVSKILHLRETVGETAIKVRRLGESTQEISRVVSLISQIAMQTNLLAINAGIEAARAGEAGQGFTIVAEEVSDLAARSASATQEIQGILENIKQETASLVEAIEVGTVEVIEGTRIVEDAKQSLNQILEVSRQIDSLVQTISVATTSQVETSQTVSTLIRQIAATSQRTSTSSHQVSQSLQQTVEISQQLQATVGTFKVS